MNDYTVSSYMFLRDFLASEEHHTPTPAGCFTTLGHLQGECHSSPEERCERAMSRACLGVGHEDFWRSHGYWCQVTHGTLLSLDIEQSILWTVEVATGLFTSESILRFCESAY